MKHQNVKLIFGQNLQEISKIEKVNITIKFSIFKLVYLGTKFCLKLTLLNFWIKLTQKGISELKEIETYHPILHIQITLDSRFQLQQKILIVRTNFRKTIYLRLKTKKN